jgi:hypothetical protein
MLGIQIIHDILFYFLAIVPFPSGRNVMMDMFKLYAKDHGGGAILGDSLMVIMSVFLASYLAGWNINQNLILLMVGLYLTPYVLYSKPPSS